MDVAHLVIEAVGLQNVVIESYQIYKSELKVEIWVKQKRETCLCAKCGGELLNIKDYRHRSLRGPPLGAFREVVINYSYLRAVCDSCEGKPQPAKIIGVHPYFANLTYALVEVAGRLMEEITCEAVARLLRLNPKTMWQLDQVRMKRMQHDFKLPTDLDVSHMSADEVHFRTIENTNRQSPFCEFSTRRFLTNLVCTKVSKVIANAEGREAVSLAKCLKLLPKKTREKIEYFALDMNAGYFKAVTKFCPNAQIAVDRFHLVQNLNERFNNVRKDEFKKAKRMNDDFQMGMLEGGRRFILMERNPNLSIEESNLLGKLKMLNTNINAAMLIVDYFHKVLDQKGIVKFREKLKTWYHVVREANLKEFRRFAIQVRRYRKNIEAYIKSGLTTAISEGINNKIKVLKRMGYGYSNIESFQLKILQRCGFLNSSHIDTALWHWHIPHPQ